VVDVYINYLRRKLAAAHADGDADVPVIETVRGEGYRLRGGRSSSVARPAVTPSVLRKPPVPARPALAAGERLVA
jgi:DNA-binding winged helix-turn-helix (wHTH) protein